MDISREPSERDLPLLGERSQVASAPSTPRVALLDNAKGALIYCVVLYHVAVVYTGADRPETPVRYASGFLMVLKPVVMPGFCLISGHTSLARASRPSTCAACTRRLRHTRSSSSSTLAYWQQCVVVLVQRLRDAAAASAALPASAGGRHLVPRGVGAVEGDAARANADALAAAARVRRRPLLALPRSGAQPVSYTHLTLPTICSV